VSTRLRIVIDTNVALDLLVFHDPSTLRLREWLDGGAVHWIACPAMRDELAHVLGRGGFGPRWPAPPAQVMQAWERRVTLAAAPPHCGLNCSDPDDQMFIDLAIAERPCWLVTRDRALLKLRRQAADRGVLVQRPRDLPLDLR
jgi:uncharacterized protein